MFKTFRFWSVTLGILVISAIGLLSGCSAVGQVQGYLGEAVTLYCSQPADQRAGVRSAINAKAAPNVVRIECANDQASPAPVPGPAPAGAPPDGHDALLDRPAPPMPAGVRFADSRPPGLAVSDPGDGDDDAAALIDPGDDPEPQPA